MFDLRHLQVLRAIAREGSLAAAARSLSYTHPTVAHHLATLEAHFGTRLVHRGPRGAVLTEEGQTLLPHAEAVLERMQLAERDVRAVVEQGAVTLRVGTFPTAGAQLLPPAVRQLRQSGVQVSLVEGELPTLLARLRSRDLHVALVFSQPGDQLNLGGEFTVCPLLTDPLLLVLPIDHPLAHQAFVRLDALRESQWIMGTTDWDPCDRLLSWACGRAGFEPVHGMRSDDYGVIQGFVAAGIGVALAPLLALDNPRPDIVVRPIDGPRVARQISVAMLRKTTAASAQRLLTALGVEADRIRSRWDGAGYGAAT